MGACGPWSFAYSINFQMRRNSATNQHFSWEYNPFSIKPAVTDGQDFWKKNVSFSGLKSPYHRLVNRKKFILSLEKYFKTLKDMIIGTVGT